MSALTPQTMPRTPTYFFQHLVRPKRPVNESLLFAIPTELRLRIYSLVCQPYYSPSDEFSGLYFTCKKIQRELDGELLRQALIILDSIRSRISPHLIITHAPTPSKFHELTKIIVSFPRWILDYNDLHIGHMDLLLDLYWFTTLHIHTITVRIYDTCKSGTETSPGSDSAADASVNTDQQIASKYQRKTTYDHILPFATRLTCILVPQICVENRHSRYHHIFCRLKSLPWSFPTGNPVNIQVLVFEIRTLDPTMWQSQDSWIALTPLDENPTLKRLGWEIEGERGRGKDGKARLCDPKHYTWRRLNVGPSKRVLNRAIYSAAGKWRKLGQL